MNSMTSMFDTYSFWTPGVMLALFVGSILFNYGMKRFYAHDYELWTIRQKLYAGIALLCLYLGLGSPLTVVGHSIFSIHMLQMVLVYFVAVPLLILAMPKQILTDLIQGWKTKAFISYRLFLHPIIGLIAFNTVFSFYHFPIIFDYMMQIPVLHIFFQVALFSSAALMWWHILAPLPEENSFSDFRRIIYIFGNGILITPACALMIFAGSPLYETYTNPNMMIHHAAAGMAFLDVHQDQQLAGVIMKISQELIYVSAMGYVFKQWLKKEKQQDGELTISDIPLHYESKNK